MSGYNYNNNWRRRERDSGPQRSRSGHNSNYWSDDHYDNYHNFSQFPFPQGGSGTGGGSGFSQQWNSWNSQSQYGSSYGRDSAPSTTSHSTSRHSFGSSQSHGKTSGHVPHRNQSPSEPRGRHGHERHSSSHKSQSPASDSRNRSGFHSNERHSSSLSYKSHHHSKKSVSPPLGSEEARKKSLAQTTDKIKSCLLSFKSEKSGVLENLLSKDVEKKKTESVKSKSKRLEKRNFPTELHLTPSDLKVIGMVNTTGNASAESEDGNYSSDISSKSEFVNKGKRTNSSVSNEEQNSHIKSTKSSTSNENSSIHQTPKRSAAGSQSNSKRTKSTSETSSVDRLSTGHNEDGSVNIPAARTRSTSLSTPFDINNRNSSTSSDNSSKPSVRSNQNQPKETLKGLKDRIMQQFIKMSKNNLKDLINNPRSRKFEFAMSSLMKEHRLILSRELRGLAQARIRGVDVENQVPDIDNQDEREPTFERLSLSDPDIAINLSHLPQEVIEKLGSLLQLDLLDSAESVDFQPNISAEDESSVHDLQNIQALQVALLSEDNIKREVSEDVKPNLEELVNQLNEQNTLETNTNENQQDININLQEQSPFADVQTESNTENVGTERDEQQIVYEEGGAAKKARTNTDIWSPYIPLGKGFMNRSGEFGNLFCEFPDFVGMGSSETEADAVDEQENNGPEVTDSGQTVHSHQNENEMSEETANQQIISNETGEIERPSSAVEQEDITLDVNMPSAEIMNNERSDNCAEIENRTEKSADEEHRILEKNGFVHSDVISDENAVSTNQNEVDLAINNIDAIVQTVNKENDISCEDSKLNNIDDCIKQLEEACAKIETSSVCTKENKEDTNYETISLPPTNSRIQDTEEFPAESTHNTEEICVGKDMEEPRGPVDHCTMDENMETETNKIPQSEPQETESCHVEEDKTDSGNMDIDVPNEGMEVDENEDIVHGKGIIDDSQSKTNNYSTVMETETEDKTKNVEQEVLKNVEMDTVEELESNAPPAEVEKSKEINTFRDNETENITVEDLYGDLGDFCNVDGVDNTSVNVVPTENCDTEVATNVIDENSEALVGATDVNINNIEPSLEPDAASKDDNEINGAELQVEVPPDIPVVVNEREEENEVTEIYRYNVVIKTEKADEFSEPTVMPDEMEVQHDINDEPDGEAVVQNVNILPQPSSSSGTVLDSQQIETATQTEPPEELDTNDIQRMLQLLEKSSQLSPQLAKLLKDHFSSSRGTEEIDSSKLPSSSVDKNLTATMLREKSPSFLSTMPPRALVHVPDSHDMDLTSGPMSSFAVDNSDSSFRTPQLLTNRGKRNFPRRTKILNRLDEQETNLDSGMSQKDDSSHKGTDITGLESGNLNAEVNNSCINEESPLNMRRDVRAPAGMSTRYVFMKMLEIDKEIQRLMEVKLELYRKLQFSLEGDSFYSNRSGSHTSKSRILQYTNPAAKEVTDSSVSSQNLNGRSELQNNSSTPQMHIGFQSMTNSEMIGSSFPNDKTASSSTPMVILPMDFVLGPSGQHNIHTHPSLPSPKLNERLKTFDTSVVEAVLNSFNIPDNNTKGDEALPMSPTDQSLQNKSAADDDDARSEPEDSNRSRRSVSSRFATPTKEPEKTSSSRNVTPKKQSQRQKHESSKEQGAVYKKPSGIATRNKTTPTSTPQKNQSNITSDSPLRRSSRSETIRPTKDLRNSKQVDGIDKEPPTEKNTRSLRQKQTPIKADGEILQTNIYTSMSEDKSTRNRRQNQAKAEEEIPETDINNSVSEDKSTRNKRQNQAKAEEETPETDINNSVSEDKNTRNKRQNQAKVEEETPETDINNSVSEDKSARSKRQKTAHVKGIDEDCLQPENINLIEEKNTRHSRQKQSIMKPEEELSQADNSSVVEEKKEKRQLTKSKSKIGKQVDDIVISGSRSRRTAQNHKLEGSETVTTLTRNKKETRTKTTKEPDISEELLDMQKKETRSSKKQNLATTEELEISDENKNKGKRKRKTSAKADLSDNEQTEENPLEESDKTMSHTRIRRRTRVSSEQQDSQVIPTNESPADGNKKKKKTRDVAPQTLVQKEIEEPSSVPKKATRTISSSSHGQIQNNDSQNEGPFLEHTPPDAVVAESPSKNKKHLNGAQKRKLEEDEGPASKIPRLNPKPDLLQWKLQKCFVMVKPLSLDSVGDSKQPENTSELPDVSTRVRRSSASSDDISVAASCSRTKKKGRSKDTDSCVRVDIPESSDELLGQLESNDNQQDPLGGIPDDTPQPPELQAEPYITINSSPMQLPPDLLMQSNSPSRMQCLLPEIAIQDENSISTLVSDTISVMSDGEQFLTAKKRSDDRNEIDPLEQCADGKDDYDRDSTYSCDTPQEGSSSASSRASKHKSSRKHKRDRKSDGIERRHVLAASEDGNVYCYSLKSGKFKRKYEGHSSAVTCLSVSECASSSSASDTEGPEGEQIAPDLFFTGSLDKHLRHFSFKTGELVQNPVNVGSPIQCMDQNWGVVYIGTKSGEVVNYNIKNATLSEPVSIGRDSVLTLKATKEGPRHVLIVGTRNKPLSVRDATSGLLLRNVCNNWSNTVYSLFLDTSIVYFGTKSGTIPAVEFTSGDLVCRFQAGAGVVCIRKYNNLLFAGCYDGNIYVFSIPIIAGSKDSNKLEAWGFPQEIRNHLKEAKHR
ncbi:hypothetical protein C0J52_24120 [Blattella germanica]|nr:hypothetical protein C0J52_24120 [Blattella germanica]